MITPQEEAVQGQSLTPGVTVNNTGNQNLAPLAQQAVVFEWLTIRVYDT